MILSCFLCSSLSVLVFLFVYISHSYSKHGRPKDSHDDHPYNYQHHSATHNDHNTFCHQPLSNISSSSPSSWNSETSLENKNNFVQNKPQYSASCSNLPEAENKFREEKLKFDNAALFLTQQKHDKSKLANIKKVSGQSLDKSEVRRCKSGSVEGLLQIENRTFCLEGMDFSPVYKTTSLGKNLPFNKKSTTGSRLLRPKRAVSSIHLPSKSVVKNKDEEHVLESFRKARSMEVLSTQGLDLQKQSSVATLKENLVKEKLDFSAFLDEITRQVISPSSLMSYRLPIITRPKCLKSNCAESRKHHKSKLKEGYFQKSSKHQPMSPHSLTVDIKHHNNKTSHFLGSAHQHHQHNSEKQHFTYKCDGMKIEQHEQHDWLLYEGISTNPESIQKEKLHNTSDIGRSCEELCSGFSIPVKYVNKESDCLPHSTVNFKVNKPRRHFKNFHKVSSNIKF